jgi:hypothetical protein
VVRTRRLLLPLLGSTLLAAGVLAGLPAAPAVAADTDVKINEVESSGGIPGDWVELINTGGTAVSIDGWVVKDDGEGNNTSIPAGTTLAAGARYTVDMSGLGDADHARLFNGATQLDDVSWATAASGTWSRCPEGTGPLADKIGTKNLPNACAAANPWPGGAGVTEVDPANAFGVDLSGLAYEGSGGATPGTLWGVQNGNGVLQKITNAAATWSSAATWTLHYPNGVGKPDAEGLTITDAGAAGGVYVATERDGDNSNMSRPAILRYVPGGAGGALTATNEWNLTADLPGLGANLGPEAVAWVPDSYLTAKGFRVGGVTYDPTAYPSHGSGLFFVGIEQTGQIVGYELDQTGGSFVRVATISSPLSSVMDLVYDPDRQKLWAACDDTCGGRTALFDVDTSQGPTQGQFISTAIHERPGGMGNFNNEGFTLAAGSECAGGIKPVFWADDANDNGHALRQGTVKCGGPAISASAASSRSKSANGWYGTPVTVTFSCVAGASPLVGGCPAPVTLATSGANQAVTRTVTDSVGHTASATANDLDIDLVAPALKIKGVKKGKTYPAKKKAKCKATDALSGVASCTVTQKKQGSRYKVTATATDRAGNTALVTLTYKVAR